MIVLTGLGYLYMHCSLRPYLPNFNLLNRRLFHFLTMNVIFLKHSLLQWFDSSKSTSILAVALDFVVSIICHLSLGQKKLGTGVKASL